LAAARELEDDLRSLGALRLLEAPAEVDVTARVMARIATIEPAGEAPRDRALAWSGIGATVAAAGLVPVLLAEFPAGVRLARGVWGALLELRPVAAATAETAARLAATGLGLGARLAWALPEALRLSPLSSLLALELAACSAIMICTVASVVGRDLRRSAEMRRKEPRP